MVKDENINQELLNWMIEKKTLLSVELIDDKYKKFIKRCVADTPHNVNVVLEIPVIKLPNIEHLLDVSTDCMSLMIGCVVIDERLSRISDVNVVLDMVFYSSNIPEVLQ